MINQVNNLLNTLKCSEKNIILIRSKIQVINKRCGLSRLDGKFYLFDRLNIEQIERINNQKCFGIESKQQQTKKATKSSEEKSKHCDKF